MTRDDIIRMAREAGVYEPDAFGGINTQWLERFAALVAAAEREECAKVSDEMQDYGLDIAAAIRGRSAT